MWPFKKNQKDEIPLPPEKKDTQLGESEPVNTSVMTTVNTSVIRTYEKRKSVEIRNQILESLGRFPKSTGEVAKDISVHWLTASRHLEYLQELGIVRKAKFNLKRKEQELWMKR